jgi:hypothetical protein
MGSALTMRLPFDRRQHWYEPAVGTLVTLRLMACTSRISSNFRAGPPGSPLCCSSQLSNMLARRACDYPLHTVDVTLCHGRDGLSDPIRAALCCGGAAAAVRMTRNKRMALSGHPGCVVMHTLVVPAQ